MHLRGFAPDWDRRRDDLALAGVVLAAALVRFVGLGEPSLWLDEGYQYFVSNLSWGHLALLLQGDTSPPLGYVTQHVWDAMVVPMWPGGATEAALRSLSALLGCLSAALVYLWARQDGSRPVATCAGLMYAASSCAFAADTQVRGYALYGCLAAASSVLLLMALRTDRTRDWIAYGAAVGLMQLTHTLAFTVVLGQILATPASKRRRLLLSAAVAAGLCAAWLPLLLQQSHTPVLGGLPPLSTELVLATLSSISGLGGSVWLLWTGAAATIVILALPSEPRPSRAVARAVAVSVILVPMAVTGLTSHHFFMPRYMVPAGSAFVILLGNLWGGPAWRRALIVCLVIANLAAVEASVWSPASWRQNWRGAAARIQAQRQPGDGLILIPGYATFVLSYYLGGIGQIRMQDDGQISSTGDPPQYGLPEFDEPTLRVANTRHPRLWVVLTQAQLYDPDHRSLTWLTSRRPQLGAWQWQQADGSGDIVVGLLGPPTSLKK